MVAHRRRQRRDAGQQIALDPGETAPAHRRQRVGHVHGGELRPLGLQQLFEPGLRRKRGQRLAQRGAQYRHQ